MLLVPAGLAAVIAVVLAVAGMAGGWIVTAAAGLCVLSLAVGWGDLLRLPHRQGTAVLVGALGVVSLVVGTVAVTPGTAVQRPLAVFAAVIAVAVLLSFGHELLRQDGRHDLVESVTGTLTGQIVAVLASGWVLLFHTDAGPAAIIVAAAAIGGSRVGAALPLRLPDRLAPWVGVGIGLGAALGASFLVKGVSPVTAVGFGVAVSAVGVAIDRLFPLEEARFDVSMLARAAGPVAAAGTVAYTVLRMGVG